MRCKHPTPFRPILRLAHVLPSISQFVYDCRYDGSVRTVHYFVVPAKSLAHVTYILATSLALVNSGENTVRSLKNLRQVALDSCLSILLYPPAFETQYVTPAM